MRILNDVNRIKTLLQASLHRGDPTILFLDQCPGLRSLGDGHAGCPEITAWFFFLRERENEDTKIDREYGHCRGILIASELTFGVDVLKPF